MIRLKSIADAIAQRERIPELALLRSRQFQGEGYDPDVHGHIVVLEDGDDITALPEIGPHGLLDVIDEEWRGYEYVEAFVEDDCVVYEMLVQIDADRSVAVIVADHPGMDERLRLVLEVETGRRNSA